MSITIELRAVEVDGIDERVEVVVGPDGVESATIVGGERDGTEVELAAQDEANAMTTYMDALEDDRWEAAAYAACRRADAAEWGS